MNRTALCFALLATTLAGCGGSSSSSSGRSAAAAPVTSTPPAPTPLIDVHGELVSAPASGGGTALAFLQDGAAAALEVVDPTALLAAGVHEGFTLVLSGDALPNTGGRTALAGAVRVGAFRADDVVTLGRLLPGFPGVAFVDLTSETWVPDGPLAAALLAAPLDRPVYVTGRADPTRPPTQVGPILEVTSWRPAVTVSWEHTTPLLGSESFTVDDLQATGAYRTESGMVRGPAFQTARGAGRRLPAGVLSDLQARVAAADLRAQPSTFQPPRIFPDHPTTTLRLEDAQGAVTVTIWAGATVPPAVDALVQALAALPATVPTFRGIEQGDTSQIVQAGAEAARDQGAWAGLWGRHVGGRPLPPAVDFTREVAVGVFDGQRPSTGWTVEVTQVTRIGPHLHLTVVHTPPPGRPFAVPTAPYHFVAVDRAGATGDLWAEGVRLP